MTQQTVEQKIPYSINQVKEAMDKILKEFSSTYINQQVNDLFHTYSFGTIGCLYNVTLNEVDDNTTKVQISCSARGTENVTSSASVSSYITEFANVLTAQLQGKTQSEMKAVVSDNNSSTSDGSIIGVLQLIGLIVTIIALIYIWSL